MSKSFILSNFILAFGIKEFTLRSLISAPYPRVYVCLCFNVGVRVPSSTSVGGCWVLVPRRSDYFISLSS